MLLQELFRMSMEGESMDSYLRAVREKMSELSTVGLKLEDDIKLAIILNGLPERYRYLVVSLEKQEKIDFDELTARLLEEEMKVNPGAKMTALMSKKNLYSDGGFVEREYRCYGCGEVGHLKRDCPKREKKKPRSPSSLCRDRCLELSAASAGTRCRKLVEYSATSAGTGCQKLGIFTWQARGRFSQKLVDISAASAGAVKSKTCVDVAWVCNRTLR